MAVATMTAGGKRHHMELSLVGWKVSVFVQKLPEAGSEAMQSPEARQALLGELNRSRYWQESERNVRRALGNSTPIVM